MRNTRQAFTIIEVIVIVVILGVIAAVIAPRLFSRIGQSKQAVAASNAANLASALRTYMIDNGGKIAQGTAIDVLAERPTSEGGHGPYVDSADALLDPWGNKFILKVPGDKNFDFDVVSYGADGQPGGTGDDADVVKP
jgi:general secretion pathway protein G